MFHFSKYISLAFLFVFAIINSTTQAQIKTPYSGNRFSEFVNADSTATFKNSNDYFLVCVNPENNAAQIRHDNAVIIRRQLSDAVFIISLHPPFSAAAILQNFKWIKRANTDWKMSPVLLSQKATNKIIFPASFFISTDNAGIFSKRIKDKNFTIINSTSANIFIAIANNLDAFNELLQDENIFFISTYSTKPTEELQINNLDVSVNKISLLHSKMPLLNGEGVTISIKENLPDTTDIDFAARYRYNPLASPDVTSHASAMATMAAGAGNSWYLGKGVASAALLTASDFSNLLPDADANYQQYNVSVQNHSYGVGIENFYGADAAAYDASAVKNDSLLFVFSAGNSGNLSAASGNYAGIPGHANLTGSFKMGKNIITVGAVDSFTVVAAASSRGPAFDGRVKPELVAYGEDGTSGAAALVSGTAAVLQQAYKINHGGHLPSAALIKAIIINSADDVAAAGIDYTSGYGNLNAVKAAQNLLQSNYIEGTVTNGSSQIFSLTIPGNISKAKFTLVWNDAPSIANTYKALVNDLDIELQLPVSGQLWKPWVLNSFADADSLAALPMRKRDSLNNTEQITLDNPAAGDYKIVVNGFNVVSAAQPFYIAYQLDTINNFSWDFPSSTDNIFPGLSNITRWDTNIMDANARLLYSIDNGNSWQLVDSVIDASKKYFYWDAPDTNVTAILKMQMGTKDFVSDTFTISQKLNFKLGFNCADSVLWYWNKLAGVDHYQLFSLAGKNLQPIAAVTDTQFVFNKINYPSKEFAVAPVMKGKIGVKSYTVNFTNQGVDCYINNFIADLQNDNTAIIQLTLGTRYLVKKIVFEKLQQGNFISLQAINIITRLSYTAIDPILQKGINTYRVRIELQNGTIIYSYQTSVFYFNNTGVVLFPNPVPQGENLVIQLKDLQSQEILIQDVLGKLIFHQTAISTTVKIAWWFSKGLYFVTVFNPDNNQMQRFKIIVL